MLPYFKKTKYQQQQQQQQQNRYHRPECLWGVLFKMAITTRDCREDGLGVKRDL